HYAGSPGKRRGTRSLSHAQADGSRGALCRKAGEHRASHASTRIMTDLASVLTAFKKASGCDTSVWTQTTGGVLTWEATTNRAPPPERLPTASEGPQPLATPDGPTLIAAIPGPRRAWLVIGPCDVPTVRLDAQLE